MNARQFSSPDEKIPLSFLASVTSQQVVLVFGHFCLSITRTRGGAAQKLLELHQAARLP